MELIYAYLSEILKQHFKTEIPDLTAVLDKLLSGPEMRFSGIDLTYLLMLLEKNYGIRFTAEDILDYRFNTLRDISETVHNQISHKCDNKKKEVAR